MNNILYIVVPCYNEEEVIEETTRQLKEKLLSFKILAKSQTDSKTDTAQEVHSWKRPTEAIATAQSTPKRILKTESLFMSFPIRADYIP